MTAPDPAVLERLREALAVVPVRLAVLFGSRATGRARAASDFDIGFVPSDAHISLADELALAATLSGVLGAEVDLVRLDGEDPFLESEIARAGICLFEEEKGAFSAFRAMAVARGIDFEETIAPHRATFLRKAAGLGK